MGISRDTINLANVAPSGLEDRRRPCIVRGVSDDSTRTGSDNRFVMEKLG